MEPFSMAMAVSYPGAIAFGGVTNIINGWRSRKQQAIFQAQNREDADRRFGQELGLRERQFVFTQEEAEAAVIRRLRERMEDVSLQMQRDMDIRSSESLRPIFNGSIDMLAHDPYARNNSHTRSLRVIFLGVKNMDYGQREAHLLHTAIEQGINAAATEYRRRGDGQPISFPSGVAIPGQKIGDWVAHQLHAIDHAGEKVKNTPTLLLHLEEDNDGGLTIKASMFGFPMGDSTFQAGIDLGTLRTKNPQEVAQVLSLVTLGAADMYFLGTYAKPPVLPGMLAKYLPAGDEQKDETRKLMGEIVVGYRQTLHTLLEHSPEVGVYAGFQLAEALATLPDKSHALEQIRQVEAMAAASDILPRHPEVVNKLKELYSLIDAPEQAARLLAALEDTRSSESGDTPRLEDLG